MKSILYALMIALTIPTLGQTVAEPSRTSLSVNGEYFANLYGGSDIGAQINAAYAAMPSTGGVIKVQVPSSGLTFSTPISFSTPGKSVVLNCLSNSGVNSSGLIRFTGTSGAAVTFNNATSNFVHLRGFGIRDCSFGGSGGTSTGLSIGGTHGAEGIEISNTSFAGFNVSTTIGDNTFLTLFKNVYLAPSKGGVCLIDTDSTNSGEQMTFENVTFDGCGIKGVQVGGGGTQFNCDNCSFDDSQFVSSAAQATLKSPHFEDPGGTHFAYITNTGNLYMTGATFATDTNCISNCPSAAINISAGNVTIVGLTFFSNYRWPSLIAVSDTGSFQSVAPLAIQGVVDTSAPVKDSGTTGNWIFDTGNGLPWRSLLSNRVAGFQGPSILASSDRFMRWGASLESNSGTPQSRYTQTPDARNTLTSKIRQVNSSATGGCSSFATNLQFFNTNTTSAPGTTDASAQVAALDCKGLFTANELGTTQTPTASTTASDHSIPIVLNGTIYYVRLSTKP